MMALKHDAQGFLVGDPIDLGVTLKALESIKNDVQAIRKAVTGATASMTAGAKRQSGKEQAAAIVALPAGRRGGNANATTRRAQTPSGKSRHAAAVVRQESRAATKTVAVPAGRDGRGRFVAGNTSIDGRLHDRDARTGDGAIRGFTDRVVSAVNGAGGGMEEADPAVKAFNEVAQPMARGYEMLTGGSEDKKQTGFLRRIFSTLNVFRKEETAYSKAANKSLKVLEEKPEAKGGGDGGGLLGMMSGLLSKIPVIGPMLAGGAGMMGGAGKGLMGAGKGLLGAGKGMLRRIPLLGALIGGVGAASDIYSSETDDSLTRRQKDENAGKAVGGFAGSVGGMLAGAKLGAMAGAIGGPIGVAIGGVLGGAVGMFFGDQAGQIIGDTVGGWVSDLREADIPGKIVGAWEATTDFLKKGWDGALEKLSDAWKGIKDAGSQAAQWASDKANAANNFIKDKTGVDVKGAAVAAKEKAVEVGAKAAEKVQKGAEYVANNTTIGKGVKAAGQGASVVAEKTAAAAERAYNVTAATAGSALETVMPKGYRHKALFDGIKGGDSLTKYGSYTDEEAAKIRELKTSGANTSANVKGGMSLEVQDKISAQAKKAGLDPVMMQKIAAMESGGNANAISSTGAAGIYQFTGQTASGVGIKNRFDVDQNIEGGMKLTRQNQAALEKSGLPVSAENLYMMHQLGPKAAQEVIRGAADGKSKADMSPETQKAMNLNYGANSASAADYIATNKKALDDRYAAVTKDTGGAQTAIAKAQQAPTATLAAASPIQAPATVVTPAFKTASIASPAAPVSTSISAPPVSVAPKTAPIADAPPVVDTLASNTGSGRKTQAITVAAPEAGQDLKDRRIAHIVTGGLSAT
ncbi:transglycosylase SLT domain-containing protein [Azonexus hydrophilus]|uniref:transglycosylase SLT domain-containing protein n=1 Tax=Azonexus hydrophilus TaxID=418702 RepID=UPI0019635460|nr:transglycosylase SLT domain-containing protein [Azonexus hydrophilus]